MAALLRTRRMEWRRFTSRPSRRESGTGQPELRPWGGAINAAGLAARRARQEKQGLIKNDYLGFCASSIESV